MSNGCDLVGKRFGRLLILEEIQERKHDGKQYRCKCDCGNTCIVQSYNLKKGLTKSCGCLAKEQRAKNLGYGRAKAIEKRQNAMIGKRFGLLIVVSQTQYGYECICDCGRNIEVRKTSIYRMKSCGCLNGYKRYRKRIFYEATGVMPKKDETVIFLDGNTNNIRAENMMSVSRYTYNQMLENNLFFSEANLTKTAAMAYELNHKANTSKK